MIIIIIIMEENTNFDQIKKLYISLLFVSIAFYILLIVLSVLVHYQGVQMASLIIILVFHLIIRLIALYASLKEIYGLTVGFAVLMTFFMVFSVVSLTVGDTHPMNLVGFLLHAVVTLLAFMYSHQIRERQLKQLATVVFCSPAAPVLMSPSPPNYTSPQSLTSPVRVNFAGAMQQIPIVEDLPPAYEQAVNYPKPVHQKF